MLLGLIQLFYKCKSTVTTELYTDGRGDSDLADFFFSKQRETSVGFVRGFP